MWKKHVNYSLYGTNGNTVLYSVQETSDGGYIAVGSSKQYLLQPGYTPHKNVVVVKLYSNGNTDWIKVYDTPYDEEGYCVKETADGDFIISGMNYYPGNLEDAMLIRVNSYGGIRWAKAYGRGVVWSFKEYGRSVTETFDSNGNSTGFALTGLHQIYTPPVDTTKKVFFVKTSPAGNSSADAPCSVRDIDFEELDFEQNRFDTLGSRSAGNETDSVCMVLNPNTENDTLCVDLVFEKRAVEDIEQPGGNGSILHARIYPNPVFGERIDVQYEVQRESEIYMVVTNVLGEEVYRGQLTRAAGLHTESVDITGWSAGTYTLVLRSGSSTISKKIVRVR